MRSITKNHHGYTRFHMHSCVTDRYKPTVHRDSPRGERFDLANDPEEERNLWNEPDAAALEAGLLLDFMRARMAQEPVHMPRIAGA